MIQSGKGGVRCICEKNRIDIVRRIEVTPLYHASCRIVQLRDVNGGRRTYIDLSIFREDKVIKV